MSLTFPPVSNQATVSITTANSNTLATLTTPSAITIFSASDVVSVNPAPSISVAAAGQDANFETRLNAMKNFIFKLGNTLEKFISANNLSGKSQGETFSNWGILWKSSFRQKIFRVSHEEKMIEDI